MQRPRSLQSSAEGLIRYPARVILSSCLGGEFLKGGLWFGPTTEPLKITPAAKKMVYPAAGCYPVGGGKGRGVPHWGILMVLSLAVCQAGGLCPEDMSRQNPTSECEQCLQTAWKGQVATKIMMYQAQYDCQRDIVPSMAVDTKCVNWKRG